MLDIIDELTERRRLPLGEGVQFVIARFDKSLGLWLDIGTYSATTRLCCFDKENCAYTLVEKALTYHQLGVIGKPESFIFNYEEFKVVLVKLTNPTYYISDEMPYGKFSFNEVLENVLSTELDELRKVI